LIISPFTFRIASSERDLKQARSTQFAAFNILLNKVFCPDIMFLRGGMQGDDATAYPMSVVPINGLIAWTPTR
jgi:hypothetical protein